jgi:hypothetical protein
MVRVLNGHPQVAVGMERYIKLLGHGGGFPITPGHFDEDRFFDITPDETNNLPTGRIWRTFYGNLRPRFADGELRWVGDKIPFLFRHYEPIEEAFDQPRWIFMLRSAVDVAASYAARAAKPNDPWPEENDFKLAARHWNESLDFLLRMLEALPGRVFVCLYERFFSGDLDQLRRLCRFLEIPLDDSLKRVFFNETDDWKLRLGRRSAPPPDLVEYVNAHAGFGALLEDLHRHADGLAETCSHLNVTLRSQRTEIADLTAERADQEARIALLKQEHSERVLALRNELEECRSELALAREQSAMGRPTQLAADEEQGPPPSRDEDGDA